MANFQSSSIFALNPMASVQQAGDSSVILLADSGQLFTCNESAQTFLGLVDGARTFAQLVEQFMQEFEVDQSTAEQDLRELAAQLLQEGVVTIR